MKLKICEVTKNVNVIPTEVDPDHSGQKSNDQDTFKHGESVEHLKLLKCRNLLMLKVHIQFLQLQLQPVQVPTLSALSATIQTISIRSAAGQADLDCTSVLNTPAVELAISRTFTSADGLTQA